MSLLNSWKYIIFPQRLKVRSKVCSPLNDKHHVGHLVGPRLSRWLHKCQSCHHGTRHKEKGICHMQCDTCQMLKASDFLM